MATEINSDSYRLLRLTQQMGRASLLQFTPADAGDETPLDPMDEVTFTVDGVCWFGGWVQPGERGIGPGEDQIVYTASDFIGYIAHRPCDEVSRHYNRVLDDSSVYPYPDGYTVEQIVEAEFASLVSGGFIAGIDWTEAGTAKDLVPRNFETTGKTFLGLLDAIINEAPTLSYWYDPAGTTGAKGGTLRFYDHAATPGTTINLRLQQLDPTGGGGAVPAGAQFVESVQLNEDISKSYDTVTLVGRGDLAERYEKASAAWDPPTDAFERILRERTDGGVDTYSPGGFSEDDPSDTNRPWHPRTDDGNLRNVCRRYTVAKPIEDLRLVREGSGSPVRYVEAEQSIWVERLAYTWYAGPIGFFDASDEFQTGDLNGTFKRIPYTDGFVDDLGDVEPNRDLYPGYPGGDLTPRFEVPVPDRFEENYLMLAEPLVLRTQYVFTANVSGNPLHDALVNEPVIVYWNVGADVWVRYTGRDPLAVTATDATLGYNKHLKLYDARLLKYTDIEGTVLRDDTAEMTAYVAYLLAAVKRTRIYGSAAVHLSPAGGVGIGAHVNTSLAMGARPRLYGWQNTSDRILPVRIQSRDLTAARDEYRVTVGFDSPVTYRPLDLAVKAREFFEGNAAEGTGGLQGKRGDTLIVDRGGKKKPKARHTGGGVGDLFGGGGGTETDTPAVLLVWGEITARTAASGTPDAITYKAESLGGEYVISAFAAPEYRPYNDVPEVTAASLGSRCLIGLSPKADNSGYDAFLWAVQEKVNFEACDESSTYTYTAGDDQFDPDTLIVSEDNEPIVSPDGDLIIAAGTELDENPEAEVITSEDGGIVFDENGDAIVRDQTERLIVDPEYFTELFIASADTLDLIVGQDPLTGTPAVPTPAPR